MKDFGSETDDRCELKKWFLLSGKLPENFVNTIQIRANYLRRKNLEFKVFRVIGEV